MVEINWENPQERLKAMLKVSRNISQCIAAAKQIHRIYNEPNVGIWNLGICEDNLVELTKEFLNSDELFEPGSYDGGNDYIGRVSIFSNFTEEGIIFDIPDEPTLLAKDYQQRSLETLTQNLDIVDTFYAVLCNEGAFNQCDFVNGILKGNTGNYIGDPGFAQDNYELDSQGVEAMFIDNYRSPDLMSFRETKNKLKLMLFSE